MSLLKLEREPQSVKDYLLSVCQQTYWNMVEMTNLKNLKENKSDDILNTLFKLTYLYSQTPFSYFCNITIENKMDYVKDHLPSYLTVSNTLAELLKRNDDEINKYLDILDAYKIKIVVMLESNYFYIPTELHRNEEGFKYPVFLKIPLKELSTLKNNHFFKQLEPVNMLDFNDLVHFEQISCDTKSCYWTDTSLGFLVRMALKYKQRDKLTHNRDFILDIYSKYLIKIETLDNNVEEWLNNANNKVVSYYIVKLNYNYKSKYIPFKNLYNILIRPFHSVRFSYTKRFLKYIKHIFNAQTFITILNKNIFNYVERTKDDISYNNLLKELPILSLVKDKNADIRTFLVFTTEPKKYIKELELKENDEICIDCIKQLFNKKLKYIDS